MNQRLVYGFGINDADYAVQQKEPREIDGKIKQVVVWQCPYHQKWKSVLERAYSPRWHKLYPTYVGCSVHEDWKYFSKFKAWMEQQDWEGKHLDKDILVPGNKIYSAEFCCFVSPEVNLFVVEKNKTKGLYMTGVDFHKGRFRARGFNSDKRNVHLGYFDTELEAHNAWRYNKIEEAIRLAQKQDNPLIKQALIDRYKIEG